MSRLALPRLSAARRARLWLSYQRYALVTLAGAAATVAAAVVALPWWLWLPLAAVSAVPVRFAAHVLASWPRKLRATRIAEHRIRAGRFAPVQVQSFCGDPCFRVVAAEILARAGIGDDERRGLIAAYRRDAEKRDVLLLVDHTTGLVVTVGADGQFRRETLGSGAEERI